MHYQILNGKYKILRTSLEKKFYFQMSFSVT
ncbi:hypothetical protein SARI_03618 [Salmonella enterica subsp. arizonae serovar 62:z4,z23:-]|uniref:Uncharacterized protein n=1 Tax=Salmonella arizonae (strain ATCC BAA-731 / CDC346-86 / RSK2980) TaxID=41514 RepID=A9MI85_SALAR|nr:hypothetical protein SARI_03618 [Salmonella enterica subsp. arizonae serovar 62:z4,z23:-]